MDNEIIETIPSANMPIKLGITKAAIRKLKEKYKIVPDAATTDGYKKIKLMKAEITPLRTGVEKERKLQVASALSHQRRVNKEAKEIIEELESIEAPHYAAKKLVDDEAARIEKEAEEKEIERISSIELKIEWLNSLPNGLLNAKSDEIKTALESAQIKLDHNFFAEFYDAAIEAQDTVVTTLRAAYDARVFSEKIQEEQEEQARIMAEKQAELDKKQAEIDAKELAIAQKERENQLVINAEIKAKSEAEEVARKEIEQAKKMEVAHKEAAELAKKEASETESRVKREAEQEKQREIKAAMEREANKEHHKKINNAAVSCLVKAGISELLSKKCIAAIALHKIDNVVIKY